MVIMMSSTWEEWDREVKREIGRESKEEEEIRTKRGELLLGQRKGETREMYLRL